MTAQPSANAIDTEILNALDVLIENENFVFVTDNLLSDFQFLQLTKKSEKIPDLARRYLVQSLLLLNYKRDFAEADALFKKSLALDSYSLTSWTHYPAYLSSRGFISQAYKYFNMAVDYVPCKGSLFNLYTSSVDCRNSKSAEKAVDIFLKMHPATEDYEDWVSDAIHFSKLVAKQNEKLEIDEEIISKTLNSLQDFLAESSFNVKSVKHYFDNHRDEIFAIFCLGNLSDVEISDANEFIADYMVENDLLSIKLTVAASL